VPSSSEFPAPPDAGSAPQPFTPGRFTGRAAIVTGAGSGIGRATALPLMLAAGGGAIVNVSSEASLRASASGVAYTASKHAVNGLTKSTAVFYKGAGMRANAVAPGPVATNIEAPFKSQHAAGVLGPIMQTTIPLGGLRRAAGRHHLLAAERRRQQRQRGRPAVGRRLVGHLSA
jgi:NAD(P)-dependent dehydrogenase (short-subunit alcohol dehydrogenase family)